ncbi:DUF6551 family protein [Niveispirillum sp. KHB5.9]|uniref:DUF6551 family protein n=1 Tax=Niveispirillum sp. KHB5.9 TaxID=3400269 RepID=UPI003A8BC66E
MLKASDYGAVPCPDLGARPVLTWIALDLLWVNEEYQRSISSDGRANIGRIIEKFTWSRFTPLMVAECEDGRYAVIDGQHRFIAAQAHGGIPELPCAVVEAPAINDQARSFLAINNDRVRATFFQLHHAGVAAGEPDALHLNDICQQVGVIVPRNNLSSKDWQAKHLRCPGMVLELAHRHGDKPVLAALRVAVAAAKRHGEAARGSIIRGLVSLFVSAPDADEARLVKVVADRRGVEFEDAARTYRKMFGGNAGTALQAAIARDYNKGLATDRRIPERAEG